MILKIRNERAHTPFAWFVRSGVDEYEYSEILVDENHPRPDYVARDFLPAEGDDINMNPVGPGYVMWLVTVNLGGNPGECWSCLARFGSVFVIGDNGKTIDRF